MKKIKNLLIALMIAGVAAYFIYPLLFPKTTPTVQTDNTSLLVTNNTADSVMVYLVLSGGQDSTFIQNVNGIFGCTQTGLVGSFYLHANDTVSYKSTLMFSGNLTFGAMPQNCFDSTWTTGVNTFEFNLNEPQESIDISAMGGVNSLMSVSLTGIILEDTTQWQASPSYPDVRAFKNNVQGSNSNMVGVYPYGCPNCTNNEGKQACETPNETPNTEPICTPTRATGKRGGSVILTFNGYTN
jgi:hypothetical protein